ncbi:MAG TPA: hypothetical protein DE038_08860 [Nitrospina sp.]|nr:hypothetical protein [Nitrospina sp.]
MERPPGIAFALEGKRHALSNYILDRCHGVESNPSEFPVSEGKAYFKVCPNPAVRESSQNRFILMPFQSEGQFNIMV